MGEDAVFPVSPSKTIFGNGDQKLCKGRYQNFPVLSDFA